LELDKGLLLRARIQDMRQIGDGEIEKACTHTLFNHNHVTAQESDHPREPCATRGRDIIIRTVACQWRSQFDGG